MRRWARSPRLRRAPGRTGVRLALIGAPLVLLLLVGAAVACAALLQPAGPGRITPRPSPPAPRVAIGQGADASWPACRYPRSHPLPARPAFAIVGVNDGEADTRSSCLARTLRWAATAAGGTAQPRRAYYVIAADPRRPAEARWKRPVWPRSDRVGGRAVRVPAAYGSHCSGPRSEAACGYVFGWYAARQAAGLTGLPEPSGSRWWIDVETERDFAADRLVNQAIVEGMAAYLETPRGRGGLGASAGVYSTPYYWDTIVGPLRVGSPLGGLPNWLAIGETSRAEAERTLRAQPAFIPGSRVEIVQYVRGGIDWNVAEPVVAPDAHR